LTSKDAAFEIDSGVRLTLEFDGVEGYSNAISVGPHKATMTLEKSCRSPGFWLRMEGDALAGVVMYEKEQGFWEGSFTIPVPGIFSFVGYWYGCDGGPTLKQRKLLLNVTAKGEVGGNLSLNRPLYPFSVWLSSKKFTQTNEVTQPYIWHNPNIPYDGANLLKTIDSVVTSDSATHLDTGYYQFKDLSNYELVCWVGGESAALLHNSFLQLRSLVNWRQRQFKFHHYHSRSFMTPDTTWTEETKKKFRKCKHILISMDQLDTPSTQSQYLEQVKNFIGHLVKAFPDDTFPIWIFSVMESPAAPTTCFEPVLPKSSHHPCNTALQLLFQSSPFPRRVRFMDATEISFPQLGENPKDVATAIALRIFVFVGKQVAEWRSKGQIGNVKGLQRGDHLEPNFELVPYLDWTK
jgi:hypothetical protein